MTANIIGEMDEKYMTFKQRAVEHIFIGNASRIHSPASLELAIAYSDAVNWTVLQSFWKQQTTRYQQYWKQ